MTTQEILAAHPAPWRFGMAENNPNPNSNIFMFDANNQIVELFTMLDFSVAAAKQISDQAILTPAGV